MISKELMNDLEKCAFLPLDIAVGEIDFDALEAYHNVYSELPRTNLSDNNHGVYTFGVSPILFRGTEEQFYDQAFNDNNFINRYSITDPPKYTFDFDKKFPKIAEALESLPMTITHVEMVSNKKDAPAHFDDWEVDGEVDPTWNIFWTRTDEQVKQIPDGTVPLNSYKLFVYERPANSFYVCESLIDDAVFPCYNEQAYMSAITKTKYPHGAKRVEGLRKFVISIWGILDVNKHLELLEKSYIRNKDYGIYF